MKGFYPQRDQSYWSYYTSNRRKLHSVAIISFKKCKVDPEYAVPKFVAAINYEVFISQFIINYRLRKKVNKYACIWIEIMNTTVVHQWRKKLWKSKLSSKFTIYIGMGMTSKEPESFIALAEFVLSNWRLVPDSLSTMIENVAENY
jgi:hypothetical protein